MIVVNPYQSKPAFLTPRLVVEFLELSSGESVLDWGSGAGFWTIPMAKKVGSKGIIVAVDTSAEKLAILKNLAGRAGLSNVKLHQVKSLSDPVPTKQKFDVLFLSNTLSDVSDPEGLINMMAERAEIGSRLVVIDWLMGSFLGPNDEQKVVEDRVILMAAKAGFRFTRLFETGTFHYGLEFKYNGEKYHAKKK